VQAIMGILTTGDGKGRSYNISQDETVTLAEFVAIVSAIMGKPTPELVEVKRSLLEANGFLPDCSPFSDRWMSELTNERSKVELGMTYTPLATYLEKIITYYLEHPPKRPASYSRRNSERNLVLYDLEKE
jgi:nucleoside-diphosphate-sugar epimerase